ncbi:iron-hydroxamate ABC transporter substrate-binding protein [Bacillus horti]|nr:iron-hydroxamate ABC transporter substrate-binding protein [Bacillus horti]
MKNKTYLAMLALLLLTLVLSACGSNSANEPASEEQETASQESNEEENITEPVEEEASGTVIYESELGPVEIPANPTRIVALTNAPNVLSLGGNLVGVDEWTEANPLFTEKLEGVTVVSEGNLESIASQTPDLIIAGSHMSNIEEYAKIAPTVVYTWGKLDYLDQQIEIGKLLNKEEEALNWVDDFKERTATIGNEIKAKYGDDVTVSVFEVADSGLYVYGDNWARGTEILYQAMKLEMPEKVKEDALGPGMYNLSLEVMPEYSGDFIVASRSLAGTADVMNTEIWNGLPAVQNNRVIEIEAKASSYSDPITLEYLLEIFTEGFLGQAE